MYFYEKIRQSVYAKAEYQNIYGQFLIDGSDYMIKIKSKRETLDLI